ncbi:MAG: histidine phosphatase family protein [Clostridia bacterium]|nr:histidine phosphatase family protein [Clostridia bacterium]
MKNTIIYLIRHSEQLKFKGDYISVDDDQIKNEKIVLSVLGEQKALELSKIAELQNIDKIYASNYVRTIATAKYIAFENNLDINVDERLGERKLGDLKELEKLGINKKDNFTTEQLVNPNFKNKDGECNLEVRERMTICINEILKENEEKNIAIVSHGAAIRFYIQNWCEYNYDKDEYLFNNKQIWQGYLDSPSCLKLVFKGTNLEQIERIY